MEEESKQDAEGKMEESKQDVTDPQVVDKQTCCNRLLDSQVARFCTAVAGSRPAMFFYFLIAFSPVVDMLSDLLTAASFAYTGHPWWAGITLVIFYLSGRFTVVFLALCPTPSWWNLLCMYLPGCWKMRNLRPAERLAGELQGPASPAELEDPPRAEVDGLARLAELEDPPRAELEGPARPAELEGPVRVHDGDAKLESPAHRAHGGEAELESPAHRVHDGEAIFNVADHSNELAQDHMLQSQLKQEMAKTRQALVDMQREWARCQQILKAGKPQVAQDDDPERQAALQQEYADAQKYQAELQGFRANLKQDLFNYQQAQVVVQLSKIRYNGVTNRVRNILHVKDDGSVIFGRGFHTLAQEVMLIPFACFSIIPIGISAFTLASTYLREAFRHHSEVSIERSDDSGGGLPNGSDPAIAGAGIAEKLELFLKTISIIEALLESLPQLVLQLRSRFYGEQELEGWVFVTTFSVSLFCIVKATFTFFLNRDGILDLISRMTSGEELLLDDDDHLLAELDLLEAELDEDFGESTDHD